MSFTDFTKSLLAAMVLVLGGSTSVLANHAGDIGLENISGKIVTGHHETAGFTAHRVFESEFGNEGYPNITEAPGFDSETGTWPTPSSIGFKILDALRFWDGNDFDTIPAERVTISYSVGSTYHSVTTPTTASVVPGLERGVGVGGDWHKHFNFELGSPYTDGVYLLQMELYSTDPSVAKSDPFYIVFGQAEGANWEEIETQHEAAIAYVEAQTVPEPSAVAILISAGGALLAWRWRRSRLA